MQNCEKMPKEDRWDPKLLHDMAGTTWQPVPGYKGDHVPVQVAEDGKREGPEEDDAEDVNYKIVPCDHFGSAWRRVFDALLARVVRTLGALLFPAVGGADAALDWRWPYVVGYSPTPRARDNATRQALVPHTDDAEITLNVNLRAPPKGGRLLFRGLRTSTSEGRVGAVVTPVPGSAVLHLGQHLHEVEAVKGGDRYALIMWCRSMGSRAAAEPGAGGGGGEGGDGVGLRARVCPCCIKNRREAGCICEAAWN